MLQKILIRIIAYTSRVAGFLCGLGIVVPIILGVFTEGKAFKIFQWYSKIFGAYGALKIIGVGIISIIIAAATDPFVAVKESEK
jgi:hypothetical protein